MTGIEGQPNSSSASVNGAKLSIKNENDSIPIPPAGTFNRKQYRWNTSEEIYAILTATSHHPDWLTRSMQYLPVNGSMILYDRGIDPELNYRQDGYIWKTRKDNKRTREDHMKLKVKGEELISGHYAHSAILSSFHRRCYRLPSSPNLILIHYLNAPVEGRDTPIPTLKNCDKRIWSKEKLAQQIYPMYDAPSDLTARTTLNFLPLTPLQINHIIDELLTNQTRDDSGAHVTAQWVLSLDSNSCSYVVRPAQPHIAAPPPPTDSYQVSNNNIQFLLSPINNKSMIQQSAPNGQAVNSYGNNLIQIAAASSSATSEQQREQQQRINPKTLQPPAHNSTFTSATTQNKVYIPALNAVSNTQVYAAANAAASPLYTTHSAVNTDSQPTYILASSTQPILSAPESGHLDHQPTTYHKPTSLVSGASYYQNEPSAGGFGTSEQSGTPDQIQLENQLQELSEQIDCLPMEISHTHNLNEEDTNISSVDLNAQLEMYDMTAEEISSTLTANMPNSCSPGNAGDLSKDLQLDSNFDLFAELNVNEEIQEPGVASSPIGFDDDGRMITLTALAPEWSYSNGGCKVLLVGPWKTGHKEYTCMFGDKSVCAELVQDGVLSCITPPHPSGVVQVKVAYSGKIISESSSFEFRDRKHESSRHRAWFLCEESRLQMALVDRLELVKCRLDILFPAPILADQMSLEQRVTALVHNIKRYSWRSQEPLPKTSYKGLTLFHLAAALGYRNLLDSLNAWKEECPCDILADEVSTRTQDNNGCIAMHWACALGRMETTLVMYYMDRISLDEVNKEGMTPLSLARAFRNKHIVEMLVQQEHSVLESKLDCHHVLNKYSNKTSPTKNRRSASPPRRSSPTRNPPVTRHNSTPTYPQPNLPHPHNVSGGNTDGSFHCSTPENFQLPPPFGAGEQIRIDYDTQSELDDEDSIVDIEGISDNESLSVIETDSELHNHRIRTLAEHIIAAIPERIKSTASDDSSSVALLSYRERSSSRSSYSSTPSCTEDSGVCTPLTSDWVEEWNRSRLSSSPCYSADSVYRHSATAAATQHSSFYPTSLYHSAAAAGAVNTSSGLGTPYHSTSAASTTSYNTGRSESPPPSAQILGEYFNAGEGVEYGLSQLTLSDTEQRKLYQAAQVIQTAFRQFKDKKQQQREIEAAVIIQTYYRRFKEFTTLRHIQKQQAATRIQSQFRSYYAQKRFKKSRDAALLIQHHYRAYKEHEHFKRSRNAAVLIQQKFRTHYNRKKCSKPSSQDGSCGISMNGLRDGSSMRTIHHYPPSSAHK